MYSPIRNWIGPGANLALLNTQIRNSSDQRFILHFKWSSPFLCYTGFQKMDEIIKKKGKIEYKCWNTIFIKLQALS